MKWLLNKENKIPQFLLLVLILVIVGCATTDFFIHNANLQTERVMITPERMEEGENGTRTVYIDLKDISEINNTLLFYTNHQVINGYIDGEVIVINTSEDMANAIQDYNIENGDLLYFVKKNGAVHHATIITDIEDNVLKYSAHTEARRDEKVTEGLLQKETIYVIRLKEMGTYK